MHKTLGFSEIKAYLATKPANPEDSVGAPEMWSTALESLRKAVDKEGLAYEIDEGGGAFYGPKIDLKVKDAIGREWQLTTIQFDFNEPERFDMTYVDADGQRKRPYMVHRALLGSIERFFGVYLEHTAGAFPVWLMPEQVAVIPVAPAFHDYAKEVAEALKKRDIRTRAVLTDERMNAKIRDAQNQKTPYMLVVGQKEMEEKTVSIRFRDGKQENGIPLDVFIGRILDRIATKSLDL